MLQSCLFFCGFETIIANFDINMYLYNNITIIRMCGIWALIGDALPGMATSVDSIRHRGPDRSKITIVASSPRTVMAFHRLAIMDPSPAGDQPFVHRGVTVICNGEIYNWRELAVALGVSLDSGCDCEVLTHVYLRYGFVGMLERLNGYFAIVLHDANTNRVYAGRDRQGVRPLYYGVCGGGIALASELKGLSFCTGARQLPPSEYICYMADAMCITRWFDINGLSITTRSREQTLCDIRRLFIESVRKRSVADRPIACLLSGGVDSSLVAAQLHSLGQPSRLTTLAVGLPGSVDLEFAQIAARHIGSYHIEIVKSEQEFLEAIPDVIKTIESYDTTSVRASVGNYLACQAISELTDCRVLFNGDYSDEVFLSYQYAKMAPDGQSFSTENKRLLSNIHHFDAKRSDRCTSRWGLESRCPYADLDFYMYMLTVDPLYKMHGRYQIEKALLRDAFAGTGLLPDSILYRRKENFSDGVSSHTRSWYEVVTEYAEAVVSDEEFADAPTRYPHCTPRTKESYYYRRIFESFYPNRDTETPYFWVPNPDWCGDIVNPSGRAVPGYAYSDVQKPLH